MAASPPEPKGPDPAVIRRHDELVQILDWPPAAPKASEKYWQNDAKKFTDFLDALVEGVKNAGDGGEGADETRADAQAAEAEAAQTGQSGAARRQTHS
jgi:hypothetical protein